MITDMFMDIIYIMLDKFCHLGESIEEYLLLDGMYEYFVQLETSLFLS